MKCRMVRTYREDQMKSAIEEAKIRCSELVRKATEKYGSTEGGRIVMTAGNGITAECPLSGASPLLIHTMLGRITYGRCQTGFGPCITMFSFERSLSLDDRMTAVRSVNEAIDEFFEKLKER